MSINNLSTGTSSASIVDALKESELIYVNAKSATAKLHKSRIDSEQDWLLVGSAIFHGFHGSDIGLSVWDEWSKQSPKYRLGECGTQWGRWVDGKDVRDENVIFGDLLSLAEKDGGNIELKHAGKSPKPSEYMEAVHAMGYYFTMNSMNDRVYVNGNLMGDGLLAFIMTKLREFGYKDKSTFQDAFMGEGYERQFHPIKEYLNGLRWDGRDYISEVAGHIKDIDGVSGLYLRKWLVGAISKIMNPSAGEQNPMWVIVGGQGWCKSTLCAWLGSPLPEMFVADRINASDKDYKILKCSKWVYEVKELNGTLSKQAIEDIKAYIDMPFVNFRPPYGRYDVDKTSTASFIGTLNNDGSGFLSDPTGDRRFRVCELSEKINFYGGIDHIDVNQLWAQAFELWKNGETWMMSEEEDAKVREINDRYTVENTLEANIQDILEFTGKQGDFVQKSVVLAELKKDGAIQGEVQKKHQMQVADVLTHMGAVDGRESVNGRQVRVWKGVKLIGIRVTFPAMAGRNNINN